MGLIVDTSVFIAIERAGGAVDFSPWRALEPFAISVIMVSELLVGVHRAKEPARRSRRAEFVDRVLSAVQSIGFDEAAARLHAPLAADLQSRGQMIGPHDLIIAATALNRGDAVLTANVGEFQRIAGLRVEAFVR